MIAGKRWVKKIPPAALGILIGTGAYYLVSVLLPQGGLGLTVGAIPAAIPMPRYTPELMGLLKSDVFWSHTSTLVALGFGIALVSSLRTPLGAVAIDNVTQERSDTNRELVGQGIVYMVGSLFGAEKWPLLTARVVQRPPCPGGRWCCTSLLWLILSN